MRPYFFPNPDAYALTAATYVAVATIVCALLLLTAWVAQAGARPIGARERSASAGPRRRQRGAPARLRAGMTLPGAYQASGTLPRRPLVASQAQRFATGGIVKRSPIVLSADDFPLIRPFVRDASTGDGEGTALARGPRPDSTRLAPSVGEVDVLGPWPLSAHLPDASLARPEAGGSAQERLSPLP